MVYILAAVLCLPIVPPDFAAFERTVHEELAATGTPGAAVAIVVEGRVVYARGFGVANVETGTSVTPETLFRLDSTAKMFNGVALATRAERGALDLDAPIATYVRGMDPAVGRVTTSQLLSRTAGFRDFAAPAVSNDETAFAPAIRGLRSDVFFTEPGAIHSYSSPGHWTAGLVLEEVSGQPYADAVAQTVFAPVGMTRSTFRPLVAMTYPMAVGHDGELGKTAEVVRPAANNTVMWPGGSIYTSAAELARFAIAMLDGGKLEGRQVLPAAAVARVEARHADIPGGDGAFYGYGMIGYVDRGVRILQHGGFSRGYGSMLALAPVRRVGVVVGTNRSAQTLPRTVETAMALFVPFGTATPAAAPPAAPSAAELEDYAGVYAHAPSTWEMLVRDGKLVVRADGHETELRPVGVDRFAGADEEFVFVRGAGGRVEHVFMGLYAARRVATAAP